MGRSGTQDRRSHDQPTSLATAVSELDAIPLCNCHELPRREHPVSSYRDLFIRRADHDWSQSHLSHYLEGDLAARARRRLEHHAAECPDCSRGIRAMKALLTFLARVDDGKESRAPAGAFDRVRAEAMGPTVKSRPRPNG
jgi:hypothetical protein